MVPGVDRQALVASVYFYIGKVEKKSFTPSEFPSLRVCCDHKGPEKCMILF